MSSRIPILDDPDDPLVGKTVGHYKLRKLIGRGGVGLVYLAAQLGEGDQRDVVVKLLAPKWSRDDETMARFGREAARLSTLRHPNIVSMADYGRDGDRAYLVMEYLKGELLSDYIDRNKALTLEQFVPIAAQLLKGVGHCHSRGMMVRDIKPANVMLIERKGRANFVKLLDFGLAKLLKEDQPVTEEHVIGTVGYLSPEQIKGEELDLRVDVYAIGVLFYLMLTGKLPFDGETNATVFYRTVNEPPPDLRTRLPKGDKRTELPDGLVELIHDCLHKDRNDRPPHADAIVERLIDAVPATLFRLPRAEKGLVANKVPPGHGNTGLLELIGPDADPSRPNPVIEPITGRTKKPDGKGATEVISPDAEEVAAAATAESGPATLPSGSTSLPAVTPPSSSRKTVIGAAAAMLVGAVIAVLVLGGNEDDAPDTKPPTTAASAAPDPSVAAALDEAEAQLRDARLDDAEASLDAIAHAALGEPTTKARHAKLERRLEIARLMQAGERFEGEGKIKAALGAYEDALALDPAHIRAREAVARLDEDGSVTADPASTGSIAISSTPAGKLTIDGKAEGTTPFEGELPVGSHTIEISAKGHETWTGEVDVSADGAKPLAVALERRRGRPTRPHKSKPSKPEAAPAPEPAPKPEAKPEPPPEPKPDKKSGPFLPTKDDKNDPVFLPTKE